MPPGMPMKIPFITSAMGPPYQIIPTVYSSMSAQIGFDTPGYVADIRLAEKLYRYAADANRSGAEIVDYVALRFSVSRACCWRY